MIRLLLACWALPPVAMAQSLVTGFERFHAAEPGSYGGALLYSELGCANCHGGDVGLPERRGPVLDGVRERASVDWMRSFLADPQSTKPGTTMPAFFDHLEGGVKTEAIDAVVHYLASLEGEPPPKRKSARHANAERGSALFHQVGCVACHAPSSDFKPAAGLPADDDFESPPVPFPDLAEKYSVASLIEFLREPGRARTDGRMPHLSLEDQEAIDIACHLLDFRSSDPRTAPDLPALKVDPAKAKRGREWVEKLNCASCHQVGGLEASSWALEQPMEGGCHQDPVEGRPSYTLSTTQTQALDSYLKASAPEAAGPDALATLTVQAFNCMACHDRDGAGGPDHARNRYFVGDEGIADAGRLPPPLTGIGQKLTADWMRSVLMGDGKVRPYLKTRMPDYGQHADWMTDLFQTADARPELPALAEGEVEAGRKLLGVHGGVNCITCHTWGERPSLGIQALDLSRLDERLKPEWFRDYLLLPQAYRADTLMPPLWPGGVATVKDVLDGDAERQIASIWEFIADGDGEPEGFPSHAANAFELIPEERPILQRTFMEGVGAHAILVGFPGGVHLAYDGLTGRPAKMWRGRFFDAYSTWFVRAAPFESPLGEDVLDWPQDPDHETRFKGYRLDSQGNPTFLLQVGNTQVEDSYRVEDGRLIRLWTGRSEPSHPQGAQVEKSSSNQFIYSWK